MKNWGELNYIPVIFTSVIEKKRIFQAIEMAMKVYENRMREDIHLSG